MAYGNASAVTAGTNATADQYNNLRGDVYSCWHAIPTTETWTYASTTTATIVGDYTLTYPVGTRVSCTNSTAKFFVVTAITYGAPNTTITLKGGTDYTLANTTISAILVSQDDRPLGFPAAFTDTGLAVTNYSGADPTISSITYYNRSWMLYGKRINIWMSLTGTLGGSNNINLKIQTLPLTIDTTKIDTAIGFLGTGGGYAGSSGTTLMHVFYLTSTTALLRNAMSTNLGASGLAYFGLVIDYIIE